MLENVKTKFFCEKEFWYIIELFDWQFVGNDEQVMKNAIEYLSKKSEESIELFDKKLHDKLNVLSNCLKYEEVAQKDEFIQDLLHSEEKYLHVRSAILAAGKKYYESVLNNPLKIKENAEFKTLKVICTKALKQKQSDFSNAS